MRAVDASGSSAWAARTATTDELYDPEDVTADDETSSSLRLNWDEVSEATSYLVKRRGSTTETPKAAAYRSHHLHRTGLERCRCCRSGTGVARQRRPVSRASSISRATLRWLRPSTNTLRLSA